jgi:hypothetical protein
MITSSLVLQPDDCRPIGTVVTSPLYSDLIPEQNELSSHWPLKFRKFLEE